MSGASYTARLTICRTLEVPIHGAADVESAIAAGVLMINAGAGHPETRYRTIPDEESGKPFRVIFADAYRTLGETPS